MFGVPKDSNLEPDYLMVKGYGNATAKCHLIGQNSC
jgi:hypothetical protein